MKTGLASTDIAAAPVRVMLLLGSLSGGGAERVAVNLANRCDPTRVDLRLALLRRTGPYLAEIDSGRVDAPAPRTVSLGGFARAPGDIARMIRARQPEVLMSFGMGVNLLAWLALRGLGENRPRWLCREDNNSDAQIDNLLGNPLGRRLIRAATRRVHRSADGVVAVARDLASTFEGRVGSSGRLRTIYNPIDVARIERSALEASVEVPERPFIVAAGRLERQKGYDLLIEAFARSRAASAMDLVILGQGSLEDALKRQAAALGVGDRVRFPGFQANPWAWFARARLFVLASRWEGFGNVVAEALACAVPVLVTDCDFGPREQVVHGQSGWVVPSGDAGALTAALDRLLGEPDLRGRLSAGGKARSAAFDLPVIAAAYTDLFVDLAMARSASPIAAPPTAWRAPGPQGPETAPVARA
ncbi:MAG: glycosyltransferase [Caulobacteraceae bacterium]|nr:glycosyltransferase [Caulobacteraceae bacterium]